MILQGPPCQYCICKYCYESITDLWLDCWLIGRLLVICCDKKTESRYTSLYSKGPIRSFRFLWDYRSNLRESSNKARNTVHLQKSSS